MRLIGVDVGGTFTDLVYADTDAGRTAVHKVSTTPDDPSRGVVQGLMALCDKYAIPRETVVDVLRELDTAIERSGMRISFPVEVRVAAADDITLSTASGRESAYVAVHMDNKQPHEQYFRLVESVMDDVAGRPHWGKLHYQSAETLRPRYPWFDEFVALRDQLDPTGRFSNAYLDRVLGPVPS